MTLEEKGIRVEALAEHLNVTPRTVRNWMRTDALPTRPHVHNLADLCTYLGLPASAFRTAAAAFASGRGDTSTGEPAEGDAAPLETRPDAPQITEAALPPDAPALRDATPAPRPDAIAPGSDPDHERRSRRARITVVLATSIALSAAAAAAWFIWLRVQGSHAARRHPVAVTFDIPPAIPGLYDSAFGGDVSPDGTQIAFTARDLRTKRRMLFVHSVVDRTTRALPASEGNYTSAFWDRDSRSLFFITATDLMRINVTGGAAERVGDAGEGFKGTVNADGTIILGSLRGLLKIVPGSRPEVLTKMAPSEVAHSLPTFLPNGDVLFTITASSGLGPVSRHTAVFSLRSRAMRRLFPLTSHAQYVHGNLLYVRNQTLFARPFDAETLRFTGNEQAIASPVWSHPLTAEAGFSASEETLVVTPPQLIPPVRHISADGRVRTTISEPESIEFVAAAHSSDSLALVARGDGSDRKNVWLYPLDGRERVRLTTEPDPSSPVFSPDDAVLYYASVGDSWANIYGLDVGPNVPTPRPVLTSDDVVAPRDVSPDGRFLLFQRWKVRDGGLWYMPIGDPDAARPFVDTPEDEGESARFSPDGKRVAFVAKRGPDYSVYIADFPPAGKLARRVTDLDGWRARWSRDGRRVYFVNGSSVMEADIATGRTRSVYTADREIVIFELDRNGGFFVREMALPPNRTVVTAWWPRLRERPLQNPPAM